MKDRIVIAGILAAVIVVASFYVFDDDAEPVRVESESVTPRQIVVYVSGQVKNPAVVRLEDTGSLRVIDAVNAAGGVTDFADTEIVNLAEPLDDGQHIHIPTKDLNFQPAPAKSIAVAQNSGSIININTADESELQHLKGVGPAIASRIVDYRSQNGAFKSIDEIKKVRGIGNKTFDKFKDSITVQ